MFSKLVAIEPVSLVPEAEQELRQYAEEVILCPDIPESDGEIAQRIGDADAVLLSYTSRLTRAAMERCPNLRYVGMCCSLYSEESANVDIPYARSRGIDVRGIRDYGDRGVVEYVLWQLIEILHGFGGRTGWEELPRELTRLRAGVVGLGTSGGMIADALRYMGADVRYFSRTRKPEAERKGLRYQPLDQLLEECEAVFTCLNKNVILLHEEQFARLGTRKILFNTSIGPAADLPALKSWLGDSRNLFCCDTVGALGDPALLKLENVLCVNTSAGRTREAFGLLSEKVLANIKAHLRGEPGGETHTSIK